MQNASNPRLKALVAPDTVALIGASDNPSSLSARPIHFMQANGFAGRICPVNPKRETVLGLPAFSSVGSIPGAVDHAYVMVNAEAAVGALQDCAERGVQVATILADGFGEAGPEGQARQERISAIARASGMMLIGPNSTGVVNTHNGFVCTTNAAFRAEGIAKGGMSVLSQSGSLIGSMLSRGAAKGIGFSKLISVGNEAVSDVGALGLELLDDSDTDSILLFLETIRDPSSLAELGHRAAALGKPVVAYVVGRTDEGQALAVSHTGALTGSSAAIGSFLAANGIYQTDLFDTFLEAPAALARVRPLPSRPRNVTVLSTTGGGGAMVIDQLSLRGVEIAACSDTARAHLERAGIPVGRSKLVDVTMAGARYEAMKEVVSTLIEDPQTGLLVVSIGSSAQFNPELAVKPIVDAVAEASSKAAPVVAVPIPHAPESIAMLRGGGVPAFATVEVASEAIALIMAGATCEAAATDPLPVDVTSLIDAAVAAGVSILDERASSAVLAALGIRFPQTWHLPAGMDPDTLGDLIFPVVAKLTSPDLPHKTEAGAVRLHIRDTAELTQSLSAMRKSAGEYHPGFQDKGTLIQAMQSGLGEALIGVTRDPLVGPVATVGSGGILAEIYRDVAVWPAPVSLHRARRMVASIKGFELLRGYRNAPKGNLDALAEAVVALSRLMSDSRIAEAEINPVIIDADGAIAVDALIRLEVAGYTGSESSP